MIFINSEKINNRALKKCCCELEKRIVICENSRNCKQ